MFDRLSGDDGYAHPLRVVSAFLHHKNSTTTARYLGLQVKRQRRELLRGKHFFTSPPTHK